MSGMHIQRRAALSAGAFTAIAAFLAVAGPAVSQGARLEDVPEDAYYSQPATILAGLSVLDGTLCEDGFCPGEPIDRKTLAVWTVRMLDRRDPPAVSEAHFDDVDAGSFYAPFIERMAELGVTRGCDDGSGFCPDRDVTRAQAAAFLSRSYNLPEGTGAIFSDVPDDAWYADDVARLASSGVTAGCGDGSGFCPERFTTRAETAALLHRIDDRGGLERVVHLTFDDGPHPVRTQQILDVLARYDARATFFVTGIRATAHPELIDRIAAEGHTLANHTWNHEIVVGLPLAEFNESVTRTQEALGVSMRSA